MAEALHPVSLLRRSVASVCQEGLGQWRGGGIEALKPCTHAFSLLAKGTNQEGVPNLLDLDLFRIQSQFGRPADRLAAAAHE